MKNFFAAFTLICAIVFLHGCGDDTTTEPGGYQYTVVDSLFFQKDYDSLYISVFPGFGYQKIKIKKFKISYDLVTNDLTDSTANMTIAIFDGHTTYWSQIQKGTQCNGHFEFEHEFNKTTDSIQMPFYQAFLRNNPPNGTYLVIKNLKAYHSY
jgi:hypothetical protein